MVRARFVRLFALYVVLDVICIGGGMGVPIFCVFLGLPVGWRLVALLELPKRPLPKALAGLLRAAAVTSGVTVVFMAGLWGTMGIPWVFRSSAEIANFGMPLLLFEPRASLIAWLVLMILVSPALQGLMTLFGGHVALMAQARRERDREEPAAGGRLI